MDELCMPKNSIILSPDEAARLGVNIDKLTAAADKQSIIEHGKQLESARKSKSEKPIFNCKSKQFVQQACLKFLRDKSNTNELFSEKGSPPHSTEENKDESICIDQPPAELYTREPTDNILNLPADFSTVVKMQKETKIKSFKAERNKFTNNFNCEPSNLLSKGTLDSNSRQQPVSKTRFSQYERKTPKAISERKSLKESVKILSNTEVYIPTHHLRKLMPESNRHILIKKDNQNTKNLLNYSAETIITVDDTQESPGGQTGTIRQNLAKILQTGKLINKKVDNTGSKNITDNYNTQYNSICTTAKVKSSITTQPGTESTISKIDLEVENVSKSKSTLHDFSQKLQVMDNDTNLIQLEHSFKKGYKGSVATGNACNDSEMNKISFPNISKAECDESKNQIKNTFCTTFDVDGFTVKVQEIVPSQQTKDKSVIGTASNLIADKGAEFANSKLKPLIDVQDASYQSRETRQMPELKTVRHNLNKILKTGDPLYRLKKKVLNKPNENEDIFSEYLPKGAESSSDSESESDAFEENEGETFNNEKILQGDNTSSEDENTMSEHLSEDSSTSSSNNIVSNEDNLLNFNQHITSNLENFISDDYDTSIIDYKESNESVNINISLNGKDSFPPETPVPDLKKLKFFKIVSAKPEKDHKMKMSRKKNTKRVPFRPKKNQIIRKSSRLSSNIHTYHKRDVKKEENRYEEFTDTVKMQLFKEENVGPYSYNYFEFPISTEESYQGIEKPRYISNIINCTADNSVSPNSIICEKETQSKPEIYDTPTYTCSGAEQTSVDIKRNQCN